MSDNTPRVSAVVPGLDDFELLEQNLPPLVAELRAHRGEVVLVDDTGRDAVAPWLAAYRERILPGDGAVDVRVLTRDANGGFAAALLDGFCAAAHEFVFAMNPDIRVLPGFLAPLVAHLEDEAVHSVVPRILLFGRDDAIESVVEIGIDCDMAFVRQRGLDGEAALFEQGARAVTYAIGGAMLLRRSPFVAAGGFDRLFDPFYYEDVDLGFGAWAAGQRVVYEPSAVVEHHHRGTIRRRVDSEFVRAVIERNRLLFQWKYLGADDAGRRHLAALHRAAIDAYQRDERRELLWLALALDRLEELRRSRAARPKEVLDFSTVIERSRPS